ncbi:Peptidoglycan/LPS O-acetylase OafA/YrhL, contains acyltransferase and SGNH-hydrolase domains [Amycolatopsis arida]|uniref:Peptidoglycan/LPS O-acetylase OafA/YrhL, contains acyltransferase and SGNH-hydrolase domains n=2 Tax=Amycolatopsis arida TaxID=587909 RepID=A0A1I5U0K7_9PSEU|nr:acyltransferase [Amycolatopsis arida]TDX95873.1 peptidoglycan/LPS O-acetylase OafA/YrhL [Amycolatopsis arida]SFP88813.1 Peptidoglycan/LPS O-acetylase OafA/YrhL, contains acyltransferase and SGNH-hydrolase domains [Amycolatopsis arida]
MRRVQLSPNVRDSAYANPNLGFAWLRLAAAFLVILNHSAGLAWYRGATIFPGAWQVSPGELALAVVFAMSGYQISASWRRDPSWWRFWARRLLRLLPPLFVVTVATVLVVGPLYTSWTQVDYWTHPQTWRYLVGTSLILLLQHRLPGVFETNPYPYSVNGAIWTLPLEVVGYSLVFVLGLLAMLKVSRSIVLPIVVVGLIVINLVLDSTESVRSILSVPTESAAYFMMPFSLGMLLYEFRDRIPLRWSLAAALMFAWLLLRAEPMGHYLLALAAAYGAVTVAHRWPKRWERSWEWVAGSYGTYLWGFLIQQVLAEAGVRDPWVLTALAIPLAYGMGLLSWNLVEKPTQRWRRYLRTPRRKPTNTEREAGPGERVKAGATEPAERYAAP